jgi:L-threonylcarbamoyladenylate synthase
MRQRLAKPRVPESPAVSTVYDCSSAEARKNGLSAAASCVRGGRLVVMPTDTVYGLGCDAFDAAAVRSLVAARGQAPRSPVPVLVGSWTTIDGLVLGVPRTARQLIEAFWPGGLSLVVHHTPSLAWDLGDSRGTVMLRMPLHPVALELLRGIGPMAVSAAGRVGMPPATDVEQARLQLGDDVPVYLDGGPCADSAPSTIVDLTGAGPLVLREGAVTVEQLSEVLDTAVPLAS